RIYDPRSQAFDFDYDSQADLDAGRLPAPADVDDTDPWHANWVEYRDGTVFVSLCSAESIVAIDVATKRIAWTFGEGGDFTVVDAAGTPLGPEGFPHCQHGIEVSDDGTDWLVYDNGRGMGASRVVRYAVDADARRATLRWQWTEPGWELPVLGDVDWLADGDLLLTMGDFEEVTRYARLAMPEETVAWEAWLGPPGNAYRSEWIDGCQVFASVRECAAREARYAELRPALFP
ncbi:MAG: aryl-sulfate sulfotransferase, partial [Myxococcota bacterium]